MQHSAISMYANRCKSGWILCDLVEVLSCINKENITLYANLFRFLANLFPVCKCEMSRISRDKSHRNTSTPG